MGLTSLLPVALFGASLVSAHARPPVDFQMPDWDPTTPDIVSRATTFKCPIFNGYEGPYATCGPSDVIWDNKLVHGKKISFYVVNSHPLVKSGDKDRVVKAMTIATNEALAVYKDWAVGISINIGLVGDIPTDGGAGSAAGIASAIPTKEGTFGGCNVLVGMPDDKDEDGILRMQKAASHEIYHCVQFAQNYAGMRAPSATTGWWVEGSARFFDGVIFPIPLTRDILHLGEFPEEYNVTESITDNVYAGALYFHYLRQSGYSLDQINKFVATRIGQSTIAKEFQDISKIGMIANNWHNFSLAYVDQRIVYNKTMPIELDFPLKPFKARPETLSKGSKRQETMALIPFTFTAIQYTFPKGTTYAVKLPKGIDYSLRRVGVKEWWGASEKALEAMITIHPHHDDDIGIEIVGSCNDPHPCVGDIIVQRQK